MNPTTKVVALVHERYADFGPKLAHEKLVEVHGIRVGRETLRGWLTEAGIWLPRAERTLRVHQPRHRRQCLGELVQIDGCDHEWFEARADRCTALVYVDDATGKLMETLALAGRRVRLHESADGQVEIRYAGNLLPYTLLDKQPLVAPGEIVENKRLGAVLLVISAGQEERDQRRMASKKLTLRQKERLGATRSQLGRIPNAPLVPSPPGPGPDRLAQALAATQMGAGCGPVMADFFAKFTAEQKARRKKYNDISNQRKRDRELLALKTQADLSRRVVGGGGAAPQPGVDASASLRAVDAR